MSPARRRIIRVDTEQQTERFVKMYTTSIINAATVAIIILNILRNELKWANGF